MPSVRCQSKEREMDLENQYNSIDLNALDTFVLEQQQEHLHLDFKLVSKPDMGRDDRRNLAKAISGFANSDGGLIVWGVEARKNADGVDCATRLVEISPLALFVSKLNQLTSEAVNPTVDRIRHRAIVKSGDSGFALTIVPTSDSGPHMAKLGEDRYYKRSGDSFRKMEHFDLEDMFGRRKRPVLSLTYRLDKGSIIRRGEDTEGEVLIFIGIENRGRGSAKAPYLSLDVCLPYRLSSFTSAISRVQGMYRLPNAQGSNWARFEGMADVVIHPGTVYEVTRVEGTVSNNTAAALQLTYEIAAEDFPLQRGKLTVEAQDLVRAVQGKQ